MREGIFNPRLRRMMNRLYIWDHFKMNPCKICGESNPIFLRLNHLGSNAYKINELAELARREMKEEINKCEVICFNCYESNRV